MAACVLAGSPTPAIAWFRGGGANSSKNAANTALVPVLPQPPDRLQMCYDGERASLKWAAVAMADAATYTCRAENEAGCANTQVLHIDNWQLLLLLSVCESGDLTHQRYGIF